MADMRSLSVHKLAAMMGIVRNKASMYSQDAVDDS